MRMSSETFYNRCLKAKAHILKSPLFENIYIGVFRSINGLPNFYACNNSPWMEEYLSKELWFVDPIVKDGLLIAETEKETVLSWTMSMNDTTFLEYRTAFIGQVKGFSKVLKHTSPTETETIVIGIGLYPQHISATEPLNVNAIFTTAEKNIQEFINLSSE